MALALYRRYRPDTFDGVIGQDQVTVPLGRALDQGKLTHAYLFSGPRGCGKTSCARILARCVNCAKGPTSHPCGECDSCKDLATGGPGSIDVVEIDAASHNGVDDARELRERAGFAPARDRYKIFILDEAHMVTQQGFNAMLKIVEEPPEHVMFIFATTEPEKVIGTIRSRTHHYPFRLVPPEVMGPYLEQVCDNEGIHAQSGVLRLAMRAGGGSMRDTLSVLDQLMVGAQEDTITQDSAIALLGFTPETLIRDAVNAIIDGSGEELYGVVQKVVVGGFDPRRFVEDLLSRVRDLLVLTLGGVHAENVLSDDAETEDIEELHRQAASLGLQSLTHIAQIINDTFASMSGATSPRMRLELLVARLLSYRMAQSEHATETSAPAESPRAAQPAGRQTRQSGGFIGARRAKNTETGSGQQSQPQQQVTPTPAVAQDDAENGAQGAPRADDAASAVPQSVNGKGAADSATAVKSPEHTSSAASRQGAGEVSAAVAERAGAGDRGSSDQAPAYGSVDEQWDAVVGALPPDVKEYVTRAKVPSVALDVANSGRRRLRMTFDTPLSQHAFALAVASEGVEGETSIPKIVLLMVKRSFGTETFIAPSPTAADGNPVESTRKMSPEQLADVKRRIALAKAGLSAANLGMASQMSQGAAGGQNRGRSKAPRAASAQSGHVDSEHEDDAGHDADGRESDSAHHRGRSNPDSPLSDDDPWAKPHPAQPQSAQSADAGNVGSAGSAAFHDASRVNNHKRKVVAVPDMSNDDDPWLEPVQESSRADGGPQDDETRSSAARPEHLTEALPGDKAAWDERQAQQDAPGTHVQPDDRADARSGGNPRTSPSGQGSDAGDAPARRQPRVAADEDTYTMQDKSLNGDGVLDIEGITRLFDVKQVETFAADDPLNPINVEHHKQQGHE